MRVFVRVGARDLRFARARACGTRWIVGSSDRRFGVGCANFEFATRRVTRAWVLVSDRATDGVGVMGRPPKKQHSPTTLEEKEEAQLFAGWDDYQENEEENKASDFSVVDHVDISIDELAQATAEDLMGIFLGDE